MILLSLPVYTCSVPALIIAASLIAKGADPSVAIAFLIAGPATNLGELNSIRVGLGTPTAAYYFSAVLLMAVMAASAIGTISWTAPLDHQGAVAKNPHHDHAHSHMGILGLSLIHI